MIPRVNFSRIADNGFFGPLIRGWDIRYPRIKPVDKSTPKSDFSAVFVQNADFRWRLRTARFQLEHHGSVCGHCLACKRLGCTSTSNVAASYTQRVCLRHHASVGPRRSALFVIRAEACLCFCLQHSHIQIRATLRLCWVCQPSPADSSQWPFYPVLGTFKPANSGVQASWAAHG